MASTIQKLMIQLGVDDSKFRKGMNEASAIVKKLAGALGAAYGTREVLRFAAETVKLAAKVEGIKTAFDQLNSPGLLSNLRKATRNTVADVDLMSAAVRANNFKISLEALPKYFEFAQQRARATGESVDYLVESIVMGIGRKSAMILDNLGISLGDINDELKRTPDYATAVGNIMDRELAKGGSTAATSADQIAQMGAAWRNMGAEIGKVLNESLKLGNAFQSIAEVLNAMVENRKQLELGGVNKDLANQVRGNIAMAGGTPGGYFMSMLFGGRKVGKNEFIIAGADPIVKRAEQQKTAIEEAEGAAEGYYEALNKLGTSSFAINILETKDPWADYFDELTKKDKDFIATLEEDWAEIDLSELDNQLAAITDSVLAKEDMFRQLSSTVTGMFGNMFSAGIQGWDEFGKAAVDAIKNMLVQLAALAATYALLSLIPGFSAFMETIGGFKGFIRQGMGFGSAPTNIANVTALGSSQRIEIVGRQSGYDLMWTTARAGNRFNSHT